MPTSNATIEPRTTGTWYVGVCESSRHDWPNPAPDFVRVASMVLSPPRLPPPMSGHMGIGTIFELWHPPDKDDVVRTVTKATTIPRSEDAVPTGIGTPQQKWSPLAATRFASYDGGPSARWGVLTGGTSIMAGTRGGSDPLSARDARRSTELRSWILS